MARVSRPILLFGSTGQVGREILPLLEPLGPVVAPMRPEADFASPSSLADVVRRHSPRVVVNCAAYTQVDRAESEPELAARVNAEAPAVLANAAQSVDAAVVHYSTDYVFPGDASAPYGESDAPKPLSVYGRTKLEGERAVTTGCRQHLILRTSWVFASHGSNFVRTVLRLASERDTLRIVNDQEGTPTSAALIARVTAGLLEAHLGGQGRFPSGAWGTYHLTAAGSTTWYGLARHVVAGARARGMALRAKPEDIVPITTAEFPTAATRPHNSRLDTTRLRQTFDLDLPHWTAGVDEVLDQLMAATR